MPRNTRKIRVGDIFIGGGAPVSIQSMCTTKTENIRATISQILKLKKAGCEIIRVAVPSMEAAKALRKIKNKIHIPLVADIHFDYRLALAAIKNGADKIRINPGNIGGEERVAEILRAAKKAGIAVRLGVNSGSLEQKLWSKYGRPSPEALVESAVNWVKIFEKNKFKNFVISIKSSDVPETVHAYELLAGKCDYPFHLGVTEAGLPPYGAIKSAIGIGSLLLKGIGDTIRVSLTADPVEEIKVCKQILKSLHLYNKEPEVIACPTCGRTEINLIKLAREVEKRLMKPGKPLKVAVMGCTVNGPGEAREADYGIAGGKGQGAIFKKGKIIKWVPERDLVDEFIAVIKEDLSSVSP
jgi:(E)-4-hydroxy-3-methylbut-2-enyl-diphosphate synthase